MSRNVSIEGTIQTDREGVPERFDGEIGLDFDLRDYFAAHAPAEIPEWFRPVRKETPTRPEPPREIEKSAKEWRRDPCYDLQAVFNDEDNSSNYWKGYADAARAYQEQIEAWDREVEAIREMNIKARYFAWPYAYADAMLSAREKGGN